MPFVPNEVTLRLRKIWVAHSLHHLTHIFACYLVRAILIYWICRKRVCICVILSMNRRIFQNVGFQARFVVLRRQNGFVPLFYFLLKFEYLMVVWDLHLWRKCLSVIIIIDFMQVRLINLLLHIKIFIQITAVILTSKIMEIVESVIYSGIWTRRCCIRLYERVLAIIGQAL